MKTLFYAILMLFVGFTPFVMANDIKWEYEQKAKIISYLLDEITWPDTAYKDKNITVCLLGEFGDPKALGFLSGQKKQNRPVKIIKMTDQEGIIENCQLLFIARSHNNILHTLIETYKHKPILLLAESEDFAKNGGSMNFILLNNRVVGLTINQENLKDSSLVFRMKGIDAYTLIP